LIASEFSASHSELVAMAARMETRNRPCYPCRVAIYAAVDSNALTYLVNAIGVEGYDPARDNSGLADERIAMSRLFMYGDCRLWVPPIVRTETADIPAGELRDAQNRMTWYQLLDHDSGVAEATIKRRTDELLGHHAGANDCRVVAETETMELDYLVTRDDRLHRHLQAHTRVQIVRPTQLWESLDIHCAPAHAMVPARDNPLTAYDWWRLPDC
jgi:hypothetical protein